MRFTKSDRLSATSILTMISSRGRFIVNRGSVLLCAIHCIVPLLSGDSARMPNRWAWRRFQWRFNGFQARTASRKVVAKKNNYQTAGESQAIFLVRSVWNWRQRAVLWDNEVLNVISWEVMYEVQYWQRKLLDSQTASFTKWRIVIYTCSSYSE